MTEPAFTSNYQFPRQLPGNAARPAMNQALDEIDTTIGALAGVIDEISLQQVDVVRVPPFQATAGQISITLPFHYQTGQNNLIVARSRLVQIEGVSFHEVDDLHFAFDTPCLLGEWIEIRVIRRGPISGVPPVIPPAIDQLFEETETPMGAINSTNGVDGNGTFTVAHQVAALTVPQVVISDTIHLTPITHFTWAGNQFQILPGAKPIPGESISISYQWRF